MFSQGQLLFAVIFVIGFVTLMVFSYKKDSKNHNLHYRGSIKIFFAFILVIVVLFLIKFFTQNS